MTQNIAVDLVTPEALLFSEEADMVVIPGGDGDFGVLYGHTPLISTIRPGTVEIHRGLNIHRTFITGGFAEVSGERCTVLATKAVDLAKITKESAKVELEEALRKLGKARTESERIRAEVEVGEAQALLDAIS